MSLKKNTSQPIVFFLIAFIFSACITVYFRLFPLWDFAPSEASERAAMLVINDVEQKIHLDVQQKFPQLSKPQKEMMARKLFDEYTHKEGFKLRDKIDQMAKTLTRPDDIHKTPYLLESDSFYYYSLTKNILETGKIGETIKGSKYLNTKMLAPVGHWEPLSLHPFVGAVVYKICKLFNNDISLMFAVSFTPVILSVVILIPFFILCRQYAINAMFAFIGSVFFMLAPVFIKRSSLGWYDNDPYNILFPLILLSLFTAGSRRLNNKKQFISIALISAFLMMIYSYFWQGWMFVFCVFLFGSFLTLIYSRWFLKKSVSLKNQFIFYVIFFAGSFLAISLAFGWKDFFILFQEGWKALTEFIHPQLSPWPDLYITVGELSKLGIGETVGYLGGFFYISIVILGSVIAIFSLIRKPTINDVGKILCVIFFAGAFLITLGAQRFSILCLVPSSLLFCFGLQCIDEKIFQRFTKNHASYQLLLQGLLLLLCLWPMYNIKSTIKTILNPIYNDVWDRAMANIRTKTPSDSVINGWWPPGHFIKAMGERRVTFDGATINFPQAYWLADVFLSTSEEEALGILRMLNDSANQSTEYLQNLGIPLSTSVDILKHITPLPANEAGNVLYKLLKDKDKTSDILRLTHKTPPPSYLFLYNEFVESNIQLSFIGRWDFKRIEEINANPQLMKTLPKGGTRDFVQYVWDMIGGPYKFSEKLSEISRQGNTLIFSNGVFVNLDLHECKIDSKEFGHGVPYSLFYADDDQIVEKKFSDANLPYSVVMFKDGKFYVTILMDRALAQSLLVKLYYFEGKGLKYFEPFDKEEDMTKRTVIKIFRVNWEKFLQENTTNQ